MITKKFAKSQGFRSIKEAKQMLLGVAIREPGRVLREMKRANAYSPEEFDVLLADSACRNALNMAA